MFVLTTIYGDVWKFYTLEEARRNQYIFGGEIKIINEESEKK